MDRPDPTLFKKSNHWQNSLCCQSPKRAEWGAPQKIKKKFEILKIFLKQKSEFQLNKQINETLFILFYSSAPRNKEQKKQIKISGFSLLHYLFDSPYFIYKNFTPSSLPFRYTQPRISNTLSPCKSEPSKQNSGPQKSTLSEHAWYGNILGPEENFETNRPSNKKSK